MPGLDIGYVVLLGEKVSVGLAWITALQSRIRARSRDGCARFRRDRRTGALRWLKKGSGRARHEDVYEMIEQLRTGDEEDRLDAAFQLGRFGITDCLESTDVVDPLLNTLRDPAPEVRAMACWALDEFNPSRTCHFGNDHGKHHDRDWKHHH